VKVGDTIRITAIPPQVLAISEDQDELHTREVFRECLGRTFRVRGIDRYGHLELGGHGRDDDHPQAYLEPIWAEPEFVEKVRSGTGRT
jgi:hypothetical protein